ncbi:MAG: ABC-2 family transporter protein [Candidatus Gracilibacteria bacterium]
MPALIKKYYSIARTGFQQGLEHRVDFFIGIIGWSMRIMISAFLFMAVFQSRASIGNYNFSDTMLYFLVVQIIMTFSFVRVEFNVCNDIQTGDFSNYLVKPISYLSYQIASELGKNIVRSLFGVGIFGVAILLYRPEFYLHLPYLQAPLILLSIIFSFFISTFLTTSIALLSFWLISAHRVIYMFFAIQSIFSGMMIPIQFFPEQFQHILSYTPFPYIFYYPAQMIIHPGTAGGIFHILGAQMIIILIEFIIINAMFAVGMKKYEATGR